MRREDFILSTHEEVLVVAYQLLVEVLGGYFEDEGFEASLLIFARLDAEGLDGGEPALEGLGIAGLGYELEALLPELFA